MYVCGVNACVCVFIFAYGRVSGRNVTMCVRACVCVYVCVCVCMGMCAYVCMRVYVYMYVYVYSGPNLFACRRIADEVRNESCRTPKLCLIVSTRVQRQPAGAKCQSVLTRLRPEGSEGLLYLSGGCVYNPANDLVFLILTDEICITLTLTIKMGHGQI